MNKAKKLIREALDDYGFVADIITNDDVSDDKEIVDLIVSETKFKKADVAKLVKQERDNFLGTKYIKYNLKQTIQVIKKYL
jgi:hypothetical protein